MKWPYGEQYDGERKDDNYNGRGLFEWLYVQQYDG